MAFFEKFGETFSSAVEDISETIAGAGKDMGQKAKDFSEIAKVAKDIRIKENRVQKMYAQLGTKYYDMHKNDAENEYEEIASITSALEEIEQLRKDLKELKGTKICPACGAEIGKDDAFCKVCGEKRASEEVTEIVSADEVEVVDSEVSEEAFEE